MKNKVFVLVVLAIVVLGFAAATLYSKKEQSQQQTFRVDAARLVREHSFVKGSTSAKVTLVEFFDPECEACRSMHPIINGIASDYGDRLRVVYRFTPLHPGSDYASSVLMEAQAAGKFEPALDLLFENQPEWGSHENPQPDLIPQYLKPLGLSSAKLEKDAVVSKFKNQLDQDRADSAALMVQQTPTFFVNGRPVFSIAESDLRRMIDAELQSTSSP